MNHLGVFAKYWQPGSVKTRLAAAIGNENAASVYREFVCQTLERLEHCGDSRSLWIWPFESSNAFNEIIGERWTIRRQPDGNLGERMLDYFQTTVNPGTNSGTTRSLLIGSDSPNLPPEIVMKAFDALKTHQCVLGPSQDGGYYLIGMNAVEPQLFQGIEWSSPQVFQQTIAKLDDLQIDWHQLPTWNDIDELDDLVWLERQLGSLSEKTESDERLLKKIQPYIPQ